jgi:hypothetical protein
MFRNARYSRIQTRFSESSAPLSWRLIIDPTNFTC